MKCHIFTGPTQYSLESYKDIRPGDFVIGADQGASYLAKSARQMDLAIGDFDSITEDEIQQIETYAKEVSTYPIKKDYTDTHLAVIEAQKRGYQSIVIHGGLGQRFDHSYANMSLLRMGDITIVDDVTKMYVLQPGTHRIDNTFPYISFFALDNVVDLSLLGFIYELHNITLDVLDPLCISNQGSGTVSFTSGLLLVIHQRDR